MALVKCRECKALISSQAQACPACGAKPKKGVGLLGWGFVLIVVLPLAWSFGSGMSQMDKAAPSAPASPAASTATATPAAVKPKAVPAAAAAPAWESNEYADAMTDAKTLVVSKRSTNTAEFEFPYNQAGGSRLFLAFRRSGKELDAYIRIDKGQMQCSPSKCSFSLRVGDGEVQQWTGLPTTTYDSDMMFVRDAAQLEQIVKSGAPLRIGIDFYRAGIRAFDFDTKDYPGI